MLISFRFWRDYEKEGRMIGEGFSLQTKKKQFLIKKNTTHRRAGCPVVTVVAGRIGRGKNANRFSGNERPEGSVSVVHGLGLETYGDRHSVSNIRNGKSCVGRAYRPLWRCRWQARPVDGVSFFYIPFFFHGYTASASIIRPARLFSFAPSGRTTRRLSNRPFAVNVFGGWTGVRSRARYAQYRRYTSAPLPVTSFTHDKTTLPGRPHLRDCK